MIPNVPGGIGPLNGVSCVAVGECTAVGANGNHQPFFVRETGGTWGAPTGVPVLGGGGQFYAVSCAQASECTAVGADLNGPVVASEVSGVWSPPTEIRIKADYGFLDGVSCVAAGSCVAIGTVFGTGESRPIAVTQSGGNWGSTAALTGARWDRLNSVSCLGVGQCIAAGVDQYGNERPSVVSQTDGAWGSATSFDGAPGHFGRVQGISCPTLGNCVVVGSDGNQQLFVLTQTDGTWGSITELTTTKGISQVGGVSCPTVGECTAVGDEGSTGNPVVFAESDGVWGSPTVFSNTPSGNGELLGVSCTAVAECTAVGFSGDNQPFYVSETTGSSPLRAKTTTMVTTHRRRTVTGQFVTLRARVTSTSSPHGTVGFAAPSSAMLPGCTASKVSRDGIAKCTIVYGAAGQYGVSATYSGDSQHAMSSGTATQTIELGRSRTTLTATVRPSRRTTTFTAAVTSVAPATGHPPGKVRFTIATAAGRAVECRGGPRVRLIAGTAHCAVATRHLQGKDGRYVVKANYLASAGFTASHHTLRG